MKPKSFAKRYLSAREGNDKGALIAKRQREGATKHKRGIIRGREKS